MEQKGKSIAKKGSGGSFTCDHCNKVFTEKGNLTRHIQQVHTEDLPLFVCPQCGKAFKREGDVQRHVKFVHATDQTAVKSKCPQCGKMVNRVQQHINEVHDKEKQPHECQVCNKKFRVPSELARHSRMHTGEKPFQCQSCDQSFSRSCNLKQHVNAVHLGEKPFMCDVCSKAFAWKCNLLKHSKVHKKGNDAGLEENGDESDENSHSVDDPPVPYSMETENVVVKLEEVKNWEENLDEGTESPDPPPVSDLEVPNDEVQVKLEEVDWDEIHQQQTTEGTDDTPISDSELQNVQVKMEEVNDWEGYQEYS